MIDPAEVAEVLEHLKKSGWLDRPEEGRWTATAKTRELGPKLYSNIPGSESIRVVEMETDD
jgi:hypothetical protein